MAWTDHLEGFKKKVGDTGRVAADKAKLGTQIVKVKAEMQSESKNLKELYASLGVLYYKKYAGTEDPDFAPLMEEISRNLTHTRELDEELRSLNAASDLRAAARPRDIEGVK